MKLFGWILSAVTALLLILFAVSNRMTVPIGLEPLPFYGELPLYAPILGALVVGFVAGGMGAWLAGGRTRRRARRAESEAARLKEALEALRKRQAADEAARREASGATRQTSLHAPALPAHAAAR
jgi:uncharacterized integral membrane protein